MKMWLIVERSGDGEKQVVVVAVVVAVVVVIIGNHGSMIEQKESIFSFF